jgi:tryptophan halogenase
MPGSGAANSVADHHIRKIVIVGGGTSGWMAAAALRTKTRRELCEIVLVESDEIGTVGVGEATIPTIKEFNRSLSIDENDFVRNTQGTFKLGIENVDWGRLGHVYFNPLGELGFSAAASGGGLNELPPLFQYLLKLVVTGRTPDLAEYSLCSAAARSNRFDRPSSKELVYSYAFHLDASLYAKYLRAHAEKRGVERVEGKVADVRLNGESGFIEAVVLESGQRIGGDLFIDCSGFRGLLIGQALKVPYEDWSHWLPCDRALAVPCESKTPPVPYTRSTAREAGWQWRIPLQHRIGNGYVFSSKFISADKAAETLLANLDGPLLDEPRLLKFTTGRRKQAWVKNCVAIGLSSGFVEPLESTSIHLIQTSITNLVKMFPDRDLGRLVQEEYNHRFTTGFDWLRDFIILRYHATEREDSELWRYCKHMSVPDTLAYKIEMFRKHGHVFINPGEGFGARPWMNAMYNQGIRPERYPSIIDGVEDLAIRAELAKVRSGIKQAVEQMSRHDDYIAMNCAATPPAA